MFDIVKRGSDPAPDATAVGGTALANGAASVVRSRRYRQALFRGITAAASLKLKGTPDKDPNLLLFRGITAAASLKPSCMFDLHFKAARLFRGITAAASLKHDLAGD